MDPDVIPVVAIVFGSITTIVIFSILYGLIKTWINRGNNSLDEKKFDRLARAFIQHKKDSEHRFEHIETILSDQKLDASAAHQTEEKAVSSQHFEIEDGGKTSQENQANPSSSNLHNMLSHREA